MDTASPESSGARLGAYFGRCLRAPTPGRRGPGVTGGRGPQRSHGGDSVAAGFPDSGTKFQWPAADASKRGGEWSRFVESNRSLPGAFQTNSKGDSMTLFLIFGPSFGTIFRYFGRSDRHA